MTNSLLTAVRDEIEDFHRFLADWFTGRAARTDLDSRFRPRFSPDLVFIPPAGQLLGFNNLLSSVDAGYASNPEFRIQIRAVKIRNEFDGYVLATYEEWQRNALASTPPDNGRVATVLFATDAPLTWPHIHETWLPSDVMAAGPYDF